MDSRVADGAAEGRLPVKEGMLIDALVAVGRASLSWSQQRFCIGAVDLLGEL